ncbi:MAG: hypothetical protein J6S91_03860, partial [Treponema sp.]|nr:hypothetical protein [Treponema sp.]
ILYIYGKKLVSANNDELAVIDCLSEYDHDYSMIPDDKGEEYFESFLNIILTLLRLSCILLDVNTVKLIHYIFREKCK